MNVGSFVRAPIEVGSGVRGPTLNSIYTKVMLT